MSGCPLADTFTSGLFTSMSGLWVSADTDVKNWFIRGRRRELVRQRVMTAEVVVTTESGSGTGGDGQRLLCCNKGKDNGAGNCWKRL